MAGFTWNGAAVMDEIKEDAAKLLLALAITLQSAHRKKLNKSNPPPHDNPAAQGEYPKKRTGFLQSSVMIDPKTIAEIKKSGYVRVGYAKAAEYGLFLGLRGWKWLEDTLDEESSKLQRLGGPDVSMGVI